MATAEGKVAESSTKEVKKTEKREDGPPVVTSSQTSSGSSRKTVKKTTYEVVEESDESSMKDHYRPSIASKNIIIQRSSFTGNQGSQQRGGYGSERQVRYSSQASMPPGSSLAMIQSTGVNLLNTSRVQEKKDMQDLNERLANFIEKTRFLEAQNRRLADELEKLKAKWGKETSNVKIMYQAELDEARRLLEEANHGKGVLEVRVASLEELLQDLRKNLEDARLAAQTEREKAESQLQRLSDLEAEISLLRRRAETYDADRAKDKKLINQLKEQLQLTRADLDRETLLHIDAENQRQSLEEQLEFLKALHEQELKELAALAYRDTTTENREYWKCEMGQALREIQQAYDDKIDGVRSELESFYTLKCQEVKNGATRNDMELIHSRDETKRLRDQMGALRDKLSDLDARNSQLARELDALKREKEERERRLTDENGDLKSEVLKLRAEMEAIMKELERISDSKLGLELEIAAYRKLLEGEENRAGLRQIVDILTTDQSYVFKQTDTTSGDGAKVSQVTKGEMSAKTTYQRSAKGPVAIAEISGDGKFVQLENTGKKDEELGEWRLKRTIDDVENKVDIALPKGFTLKAGQKIKLWAKGQKPADGAGDDIEISEGTWGTGSKVVTTKLVNAANEERATHVQRTTFAQS
jgi:intermediate filament protein if